MKAVNVFSSLILKFVEPQHNAEALLSLEGKNPELDLSLPDYFTTVQTPAIQANTSCRVPAPECRLPRLHSETHREMYSLLY